MASASPSVLQAVSLQKRYGSRTVVRDVSIEVSSGEVVGLLGPNGAGKTTSFYMIVGLVPLDGGDIRLNQKKISHLPSISVPEWAYPTYLKRPLFFVN